MLVFFFYVKSSKLSCGVNRIRVIANTTLFYPFRGVIQSVILSFLRILGQHCKGNWPHIWMGTQDMRGGWGVIKKTRTCVLLYEITHLNINALKKSYASPPTLPHTQHTNSSSFFFCHFFFFLNRILANSSFLAILVWNHVSPKQRILAICWRHKKTKQKRV